MQFSLIVSTIGRAADLRKLLESLAAQTCQNFEVIVVDQSRGVEIEAVVGEFQSRMPIKRLPMNERGLSRGRNLGWDHAAGEIINFPDDDCTWPPNLLQQVTTIFTARPTLDALTTRVENVARNDIHGGPVNRQNIFRRSVEFSLFLRRERVGELRYDPTMGVGAGTPWGADEGPDLMLRMLSRGLAIEYFPELCIHHPDPQAVPAEQLYSRTLAYSRGRGYLLRKHRYPFHAVAYSLLRSLGGAVLMLGCGRWVKSRMYWLAFRGKCAGYFASAT